MNLSFAITSLEQGLAFGIMALGVFISFRILSFADLSVDGSLPLGAAISARLLTMGIDPFLSIAAAVFAGALAGAMTGFLNTKLKIAPLLSGILTMTSLYSINLRIMRRPNIPLIGKETIFTKVEALGISNPWNSIFILITFIIIVKLILDAFLNTQIGFALRATGDNPQMIRSMGISTNSMKMLGLTISNALVALSGAIVGQYQGFADVNMGIGIIIAGLASVIIGEVIIGERSMFIATIGVITGSILYRFSISIALNLGLAASDLKLLTALLVIIFLSTPRIKKALR
ncbi:MAG: ABC transporter permease [Halanaerobium sp.]